MNGYRVWRKEIFTYWKRWLRIQLSKQRKLGKLEPGKSGRQISRAAATTTLVATAAATTTLVAAAAANSPSTFAFTAVVSNMFQIDTFDLWPSTPRFHPLIDANHLPSCRCKTIVVKLKVGKGIRIWRFNGGPWLYTDLQILFMHSTTWVCSFAILIGHHQYHV